MNCNNNFFSSSVGQRSQQSWPQAAAQPPSANFNINQQDIAAAGAALLAAANAAVTLPPTADIRHPTTAQGCPKIDIMGLRGHRLD